MSTESIPRRKGTIHASFCNLIKSVLAGDIVPRNSKGVAAASAGSIGAAGLEWLRAFISCGHWDVGDEIEHHSYNGTVAIAQGFMKCDGRIINETNYDLEHGAGSWDKYIGASPLNGKYLLLRILTIGSAGRRLTLRLKTISHGTQTATLSILFVEHRPAVCT
jgi:hypothetical protein